CVEHSTAATATTLLRSYLQAPYAFHLRRNSVDLVHNATHAARRVFAGVLAPALALVTEVLVAGGITVVLLTVAPRATLVATGVLAGLAAVFLRLTRRGALGLGTRLEDHHVRALRHLQQALAAVKEITVLGRQAFFIDASERAELELARARWSYGTFAALPRIVVETAFVCGALMVIVVATLTGGTSVESVPLLGLYAYAGFRIIPSVNRIIWYASEIRIGAPAVSRIEADLAATRTVATTGRTRVSFRDRIELTDVGYAHDTAEAPVLAHVSLTIRRGESIGIVGPTGAGKSTLVDLLVGLLTPTSGRLTIDGVDLVDCRAEWQRQLGYVPQTITLVDDTLQANVALGVGAHDVDAAALRAAVDRAQLTSFVASLPTGLLTVVGERGVRLSGGERQRVGIARALYHAPPVLVFDEATAALDPQTEADLAHAIEALRGGTTLVVVAHRLSTVRRCDRLILVRDGRIVDVGPYEELMARSAEFRALARAS
ncbi:MAG: ABC transporter ATP-binding protein, partial [Candidatus Binatia bacterium]